MQIFDPNELNLISKILKACDETSFDYASIFKDDHQTALDNYLNQKIILMKLMVILGWLRLDGQTYILTDKGRKQLEAHE